MPSDHPPYLSPRLRGPRAPRVLLVDDDDLLRRSTMRFLSRSGFEVIPAPSGLEALARMESGVEIDVAVVDLEMPGMDGVTLIRELRERRPRTPVGLWSASHRLHELSERDLEQAAFVIAKARPIGELVQALAYAVYSSDVATDSGRGAQESGAPPAPQSASGSGHRARPASGWLRRDDIAREIDESTG